MTGFFTGEGLKFDPQIHHRRSIRLKGYDYSQAGAYFVTICAWQRECLFGEVVAGEVRLSALGMIVREEWMRSGEIRKELRLYKDEFVIMPNHVHGIVWIIGADGNCPEGGGASLAPVHGGMDHAVGVGADGIRPDGIHPDGNRPEGEGASLAPEQLRREARSLSSFIAGFKATVTSRARRELNISGIWQRNYYEHVIRDEVDLRRIEDYIQNNPLRWGQDQLHPQASPNKFNQD